MSLQIVSPRTSLDVKIIYSNLFFEKALPIYVFLYQYCYFKVFFIKGYWKVILIFNILYFYFASILSKFIKDTNVPQSFFRIFRILIANCIKSLSHTSVVSFWYSNIPNLYFIFNKPNIYVQHAFCLLHIIIMDVAYILCMLNIYVYGLLNIK